MVFKCSAVTLEAYRRNGRLQLFWGGAAPQVKSRSATYKVGGSLPSFIHFQDVVPCGSILLPAEWQMQRWKAAGSAWKAFGEGLYNDVIHRTQNVVTSEFRVSAELQK